MSDTNLIIEVLREVYRTKKEPSANGNAEREHIIEELKENHCIYETTIKHAGACMANPYDKFTPYKEQGYSVDKDVIRKIYGIDFPC